MRIEVGTVKGFQDFLPPESLKRQAVKDTIEKWFKLYGFLPVETPIVEYDELMRSDSLEEDGAVSERFRLRDRGGRNLGLRYEFTFQLARIFKQYPNIKLPFKRYQIGPVFRDEPISARRFRQFVQCDADIVGDNSVEADVETLALLMDILRELKIKAEIEVNNRKLLTAIIESVQIRPPDKIMRELDKVGKIGEDEIKSRLKKYTTPKQIVTLFKLLEKDLKFFKENEFDGSEEISQLIKKCKQYGIKLKFNPNMIRGMDYYTGNIFEIKSPDFKETIAAGGRYDKLIGKYSGRDIPAVGVSFGLARITELADVKIERTKALIISIDEDSEAIKLSKTLRSNNISSSISNKTSKALEYANSLHIPYVIFIGEAEVSKNKFKLKEMASGNEKFLSEKQIINKLKK